MIPPKFVNTHYHVGVSLTAVMLFVRGVVQVLELSPARGMDAAISGMAGLGHILTGAGIVLLFVALRKAMWDSEARSCLFLTRIPW